MKPIDRFVNLLFDKPSNGRVSRQEFLELTGRGLAVGTVGSVLAACEKKPESTASATGTTNTPSGPVPNLPATSPPATVPSDPTKPIELEQIKAKTEQEEAPTPTPLPDDQRVGYAIVGLGHLTLNQILPAFSTAKKSKVVALVSGSPEKLQKVAAQYGIKKESCYSYADYDKLRDNKEVQAIYIVLPNGMHAEYTIRGAQAGKHILCEKPMANTAAECQAMIDACQKANRKLMIAYRIQYEPHHKIVREMVQKEQFGKVKSILANNGQNSDNPDHWRFKKALAGGGSLPDVGLYCINTIRYVLGEEPSEVTGYVHSTPNDPRFTEVEEQVNWLMKFPSGVQACCATSYGHHDDKNYKVLADKGWIKMDPAFPYKGLKLATSQAQGNQNQETQHEISDQDQFATEIDHFSECVLGNKTPFTPGEEGLQDQKIIEAIYQSAREGRPIKLAVVEKKDAFRGEEPTT
ncbi:MULTISPECIES: Gfo/Idh/MocA family oxidoreductase [unclassified Spirosoma]|uniref:Gfo/Idh/MocA family oxidoreductase n=1 Tax=unclassified Spirosoma TaxID=2621999 RepID=UPI00095C4C70|nr:MULTISPECIES: Gfo/Idh/MocA family oxidoreductase [unclassified Spirosoma]MBN8821893.1 Gfo/Idh/MocA family oxidoreductase [Spirosoma sp.]OJW80623.1 MAG: dehydrogenase [Spirosoma sp. 48-14]